MPGTLTRGQDGEAVATGWVLIAYEMVGDRKPLADWHGEIAVSAEDAAKARDAGSELYLQLKPYGGVFEPWHGPVTVEPVDPEFDPVGRRLKLRSAGPMTRSLYHVEGEDDEASAVPEEPLMEDEGTIRV
jgi:hypothetical protein